MRWYTFMKIARANRKMIQVDIKTRVEELEVVNQSLRNRDKLKDDAIAHLSDQVIALTARLDSIEKRPECLTR
jgi:hypothetical protein